MKILKERNRNAQKDIYNDIDKIDSKILDVIHDYRKIDNEFLLERDKQTIKQVVKMLELCASKTLLLKGRIIHYELGNKLFMERQYLEFYVKRKTKGRLKYVPFTDTNYNGKKFYVFKAKDLGAKAQIDVDGTIVAILIPIEKESLIRNE